LGHSKKRLSMTLDTSSFPAYLRSLEMSAYTPKKNHRFISGPPATIVEIMLRLGLGPRFFDTPRVRQLLAELGLEYKTARYVMENLRTRAMWWPLWEEMAQRQVQAALQSAASSDSQAALNAVRSALLLFLIGLSGDGFYFYAPVEARWKTYGVRRRLFALERKLTHAHTERLLLEHPRGHTWGLLHYPATTSTKPYPAIVAIHPLSSDKETFDYCLNRFREAGYATLCIDLPGHGENFYDQHLTPDSEWVGVAALEALAQHPNIDPKRLGVLGGSLGAHFALRTAAASPLASACLAFATPFDLGVMGPSMMPGIVEHFAWTIGSHDKQELQQRSAAFHLRDVLGKVHCPVCLVHGTNDSVCDFTTTFTIVSQLKAPATVIPLPNVDHEAAYPESKALSEAGINWLSQNL